MCYSKIWLEILNDVKEILIKSHWVIRWFWMCLVWLQCAPFSLWCFVRSLAGPICLKFCVSLMFEVLFVNSCMKFCLWFIAWTFVCEQLLEVLFEIHSCMKFYEALFIHFAWSLIRPRYFLFIAYFYHHCAQVHIWRAVFILSESLP